MRLVLHTVICCCVFTTVLPLVKGATGEHNVSLKKRIRVWLQSYMEKDLVNSLLTATVKYPDIQVRPEHDNGEKTASPPLSSGLNSRPRRSASFKLTGCALFTCVYHDLLYLLHELNKNQKVTAPESKLGSKGYGRRRRRSLLHITQLALQTARQGKGIGEGCQVHRHANICAED